MKKYLELAKGLQYSNELSVAELAKAYIALRTDYDELELQYVKSYANGQKIESEAFIRWLRKQEGLNEVSPVTE